MPSKGWRISDDVREEVRLRDGRWCRYCRVELVMDAPPTRGGPTYDHVVPRAEGGGHGADNVVLACRPCNAAKGAGDPAVVGGLLPPPPLCPRCGQRVLPEDMRGSLCVVCDYHTGGPRG